MIFQTTKEQLNKLHHMLKEMASRGVSPILITQINKYKLDQGLFDLVELWYNEENKSEQENILKDIEDSVNDWEGGKR